MLAGGRNVVLPGFDADKAVKCIEEHQVTVFVEFPPMLSKIMAKAEEGGRKLSSIRHVLGIDQPELVKRFQDATGATFWASYGQSETSGLVTVGPYFERLGSTGLPLQLIEVEVVGDSGNILERGASGEIVVRGPHVFKGYWNKDADTRYTFRDGWHHTGDMGHIDEDGYLWFEGRAEEKELIKPGGENVYPAEVEKVVMECPAVQEVVVIGVPDPTWGEAIKAVCVLVPGSSLSEGDVIEFVAARIARFKKPKHVVFVDDLPKTSDGKLDRATIKAQHGKA
jgi:long-chain acyl-CoA synthetase